MENIESRIKAILEKDKDNSELSTFITSLLENSSPAYYLKSGLSRKNSYNDTLTPSIFIKYFYVERTRENGISELSFVKTQIEKLFRNQNYNVMALRSFRGSGKSVFVNILASEYSSNEYKVVKIDLEQGEYDYTDSMLFTNILTELMQFHHKEIYKTGIAENQDFFKIYEKLLKQIFSIERVTQNFFVVDNHSYLEEIWNKLEELNKLEKNRYNTIDIYETEARQKFLSNDEITSNEEKRRAVLFFYFIVTIAAILAKELYENKYDPNGELKISGIALNSALRHKYLFIFDNIEAYNSSRAGTVYQVIKNIHSALRRTFYGLGIEEKFFTHFECIIALRTRTSIALHDSQRGENIIYKTYDLGTPDFFDGALLAKYKFLYKLNQKVSGLLRATELYSIVEHVCQFFFPQSEIDKYLEDDNTMIGKKVFINEKFAPFFAYDFRKMSEEVGRALLTNDYGTRIRTLLDSYTTEGINGARMILFRLIFDDFVDEGIFDAFGFHALDGQEKHSISRAILLYLFYNRKININLEFLLSVFIRIYSKSPEDFSNALWKLSQFNDSSENTSAPPIDEWGNLLEFTNIEGTIDNGRLSNLVFNYFKNPSSEYQMNSTPISDIGVKITKTGECFINYISKQFEFFASRINEPKSALFAFEIDNISAVERVTDYINEMFLAIRTYTNAM
ncbi:MAG: hypothetical protein K2K50_08395, partial [Anaeroplasmataceae bacterium]|nr:hypothetical protein [Anaeroplasmataceae bacterium]